MERLSGKFVLRLDPEHHLKLKRQAQAKGLSLNQWINRLLQSERQPNQIQLNAEIIHQEFRESLLGVILFGSVARGEALDSSDLDLLIVLRDECPIQRNLYQRWDSKILPRLSEKVSPQFSHLPNLESISSLWLEVALEGEILFDPTQQLKVTLIEIRRRISEGQYHRKISHGHPYWMRTAEKG